MIINANSKYALAIEEKDNLLIYFYSPTCHSCSNLQEFFDELQSDNEGISLKKIDISQSENKGVFNSYCEFYNVDDDFVTVPMVFIGDIYLHGEKEIRSLLYTYLEDNKKIMTPVLNKVNYDMDTKKFSNLNVGSVFVAGLVNGINPCSLSLILFFLSLIVAANSNIKKYGYSFIAGKFIAFFLLGLFFYSILNQVNFDKIRLFTNFFILICAAIFFLLNIHDFIVIKQNNYERIKLQLPKRYMHLIQDHMKKIDFDHTKKIIPFLCLMLGMLIACGEFLCTGQVYLSTIVTIIKIETTYTLYGVLYLLIFDVAFILPLFICILLIHKGKSVYEMSNKLVNKLPFIKLINSVFFLIIAIIFLLN
jgi:cytochrome c biogenesis protein CcdA/glutaredoxin